MSDATASRPTTMRLEMQVVTPQPRTGDPPSETICQHSYKRESRTVKLLVCKRCKRAKYCNTECQRAHWQSHKDTCARNAAVAQMFKDRQQLMHDFKVWTREYKTFLHWTVTEALQLKKKPENILTQFLYMVVEYTGGEQHNGLATNRIFTIKDITVDKLAKFEGQDPETERLAKEIRDRGGAGVARTAICCRGVIFLMRMIVRQESPKQVDLGPELHADWKGTLMGLVNGNKDPKFLAALKRAVVRDAAKNGELLVFV